MIVETDEHCERCNADNAQAIETEGGLYLLCEACRRTVFGA